MPMFSIDNNGVIEGPYTAQEILSMDLSPETRIFDSETRKWHPLSEYNMESYDAFENDEAEEFLLNSGVQPANDCSDNNQTEENGMTEEELQEWRAKRQEKAAKNRRSGNRINGFATMIGGAVMAGIGALITALSGGSVIKIGLLGVGGFLILKGLLQLISGED